MTNRCMLIIMGKSNCESDYYGKFEKETLKMDCHDKKGEHNIIHCNMKGCIKSHLSHIKHFINTF